MDKNKILEMSRKENEKNDPFELEVAGKANNCAGLGMAIVVFILYVTIILARGEQDYGIWSIMAISMAVRYLYTGIKLKKKDQLGLGVLWGIIFAISFTVGMIKIIRGH